MTQLIIDLFKVAYVSLFVTNILFVLQYTRLAPWWKDPVGRTIASESLVIAMITLPPILSIFLMFSRLDSLVASWIDLGLVFIASGILLWRTWIWQRNKQGLTLFQLWRERRKSNRGMNDNDNRGKA